MQTYMWIFCCVFHDILPVSVDGLEESSFLGHLLHDVLRGEDGLQVEPLGLHLQPLVNRVLDTNQLLLPALKSHTEKTVTMALNQDLFSNGVLDINQLLLSALNKTHRKGSKLTLLMLRLLSSKA